MKLSLEQSESYNYPVKIPVRTEAGPLKDVSITVRFKRLTQDELTEYGDDFNAHLTPPMARAVAKAQEGDDAGALIDLVEASEREQRNPGGDKSKSPIEAMRASLRKVLVGWKAEDFDPPTEYSEEVREKLFNMPAATPSLFYAFGNSIPVAKQKN